MNGTTLLTEIERYMSEKGLSHSDSIEALLDSLAEQPQEESNFQFGDDAMEWKTIHQVHAEMVPIDKDLIGLDVALDLPFKDDWIYGKVIAIGEYQGAMHVRWQMLKTITLLLENGQEKTFKQEVITQLLVKEDQGNK